MAEREHEPDSRAHPGERVDRWLGWYARTSMVVVSVLLLLVATQRAATLAPLVTLLLWWSARRAGTGYRRLAGVLATLLLVDAGWQLAPLLKVDPVLGAAAAAPPAIGIGVVIGRRPSSLG